MMRMTLWEKLTHVMVKMKQIFLKSARSRVSFLLFVNLFLLERTADLDDIYESPKPPCRKEFFSQPHAYHSRELQPEGTVFIFNNLSMFMVISDVDEIFPLEDEQTG